MNSPLSKEDLTLPERLRKAYDAIGQAYGYVGSIDEAADELERLYGECRNWKELHDANEACIADLERQLREAKQLAIRQGNQLRQMAGAAMRKSQ